MTFDSKYYGQWRLKSENIERILLCVCIINLHFVVAFDKQNSNEKPTKILGKIKYKFYVRVVYRTQFPWNAVYLWDFSKSKGTKWKQKLLQTTTTSAQSINVTAAAMPAKRTITKTEQKQRTKTICKNHMQCTCGRWYECMNCFRGLNRWNVCILKTVHFHGTLHYIDGIGNSRVHRCAYTHWHVTQIYKLNRWTLATKKFHWSRKTMDLHSQSLPCKTNQLSGEYTQHTYTPVSNASASQPICSYYLLWHAKQTKI